MLQLAWCYEYLLFRGNIRIVTSIKYRLQVHINWLYKAEDFLQRMWTVVVIDGNRALDAGD